MSRHAAAASIWLVVAATVWMGFFELYVSRGAREYLQLKAEAELGRVAQPSMNEVMGRAKSDGALMASIWASIILAGGFVAARVSGPRP
ncbi:MAG TPA: hypothetical protein VFV98_13530 [Vicinamibacterales bacterium]|nr:hypothetical protein [Vicinamibacterales bacterium]